MAIVEFQSVINPGGTISVPQELMSNIGDNVRVSLYVEPKADDYSFDYIKIDTSSFSFNRDEANER